MPENEFPKVKPRPSKVVGDGEAGGAYALSAVRYAELVVTSNYTFLTGASHPEEMVERAAALGHRAVALADTNTLAGIVRAHVAAKGAGIPFVVGCRLVLSDAPPVLVYPTDRSSYSALCRLLTLGKRRAPKGECHLTLDDLLSAAAEDGGGRGLLGVVEPPPVLDEPFLEVLRRVRGVFAADRLSLAAAFAYRGDDAERVAQVAAVGERVGVPIVATNRVLYHEPGRRALQDVVTCIRHGCTVESAGYRLEANAERHLKAPEEMARLFARWPRAVARAVEIAERASVFSLDELRYEYPAASCPEGVTASEHLRALAWEGARVRYPGGVPETTRASLDHELALIAELKYEAYFLTCHDIVRFARSRGILCQGRGGAANSAVCYCLGITEVDPARFNLLFERFISRERNEPPDIDIDFEHERREEVLQYIYETYGRERAAMTAEVISYRGRSAVREVGKAMGLPEDTVDALAKNLDRWGDTASEERVREIGLNPRDPTIRKVLALTGELVGFPRHLSQHVGGMVITRGVLCDLVPIENAAMEDRTVIEWDKDDIDAMGMLKVDCLGLGMLTCIRRCLQLIRETQRRRDGETECVGAGASGDTGTCGGFHGWGQNISGSGGLAEGDGGRDGDLSGDRGDARWRAVRADEPAAEGGCLHPLEHRGGVRAREPGGPGEVSACGTRVVERSDDPVRAGDNPGHDARGPEHHRAAGGDRQGVAGVDQQPEKSPRLIPRSTSSLRDSVSSSLHDPVSSSPSIHTAFAAIAAEPTDPAVYDMIGRADTVGVFQIESRAQMSMLPRLKPRCFYDLVIEVAIVRPGPIQGGMVHPYLRRREGKEEVRYPNAAVEGVLGRTLGVPLFQEQAMQLAIVAAGFTPDQADGLRRSMAAWKRKGNAIARYGERLIDGMLANGYPREFAERCFEQIQGFSEYGFPESHAASFAILVYVSAWLKKHHPAAFAAALINSQPMGFYQPAQIVRDAQEHGVEVRSLDANHSGWDCSLEGRDGEIKRRRDGVGDDGPGSWGRGGPALRLGMRLAKGLGESDARAIEAAVRVRGPFRTVESLWRTSGASVRGIRALARADGFGSMGLDRQRALWQTKPLRDDPLPLFEQADGTDDAGLDRLPSVSAVRRVLDDYGSVGLSLKAHPVSFIRDQLAARGVSPAGDLRDPKAWPSQREVAVAGVVLCRQRPGTASGVTFITLEDETGIANLVVWRDTFEQYRRVVRLSSLLLVRGVVERAGEVVHIHAKHLESVDNLLPALAATSRDFH